MRTFLPSLALCTIFAAVHVATAAEKKPATSAARVAGSEVTDAADQKDSKPSRPLPFQGTVFRVNKTSNTFITKTKAGKEHVSHLTEKSKILKDDAPATLSDIKSDQIVRGSRIKLGENTWEVVKVIIGAKPASAEKKETAEEDRE